MVLDPTEWGWMRRTGGDVEKQKEIQEAMEERVTTVDKEKPPFYLSNYNLKDPIIDELLPLLIILGQRKPEIKEFYKNLMQFIVDYHRGGATSWVGQWMNNKLLCKVMERFGLLELGGSASYDAGLSWAFGVISATEFLSDIQVGDVVETYFTGERAKYTVGKK